MTSHFKFRRGLTLPLKGAPNSEITAAEPCSQVAVVFDRPRQRMHIPKMECSPGDHVELGQVLARAPSGLCFTSPGTGTVQAIHRGERRVLQSIVVKLEKPEEDREKQNTFRELSYNSSEALRALLLESGLWSCIRQRPLGCVPDPKSNCQSFFITAIDTEPLAGNPEIVLAERTQDFERGILACLDLTEGPVYVCQAPSAKIPIPKNDRIHVVTFEGPHPAGLPGTHIHCLAPASEKRIAWHMGYHDVADVGALLRKGFVPTERVIALSGDVENPRMIRTRRGANIFEIISKDQKSGTRIIEGSPLFGRHIQLAETAFLSPRARTICALQEDDKREFLGWLTPGIRAFSTVRAYLSRFWPFSQSNPALTTATHGSPRAMVPIGMYERVMPHDLMISFLLRALIAEDMERAIELGALELDEEDLALCTCVCPGKIDFGLALRKLQTSLENQGL